MAALVRASRQQRLPAFLLVRGGYGSSIHTLDGGICAGTVNPPDLGFASSESGEAAFIKNQHRDFSSAICRHGTGNLAKGHMQHLGRRHTLFLSSLHTLVGRWSVQPRSNYIPRCESERDIMKSFALGGVRHESVYEKRIREIRLVRARQRRLKRGTPDDDSPITLNSGFDEDTTQPPPSQPLLGSLMPTCLEEEILAPVLARPDLLVTRNVEWANLAFGFEQQNRYVIMDPRQPQAPVGYILEDSNLLLRQIMRTRRPFVASVLDAHSNEIFRVRRPAWLINSSIFVEVDGKVIGECHRRWHLWRRIYDIYLGNKQFAVVENPGFWHWTFSLKDEHGGLLAEIDRNWRGFGYEFLTDAGQYMIRFGDILPPHKQQVFAFEEDLQSRRPLLSTTKGHSGVQEMQQLQAAAEEAEPLQVSRSLTLSERAVALALAVSLDNDYFSRHSHPGWGMPFIGSEANSSLGP